MEEFMLTEGAKMQCSCGSSLSDLKVTSHNFNYICSFLQATEHDNKAGENIFPFGICSQTQKSCHPTPLDWKGKIEWMDIKGSAAITDQSTLPCALGGIISCKENTQYSWAIRHKEEEEIPEEDYDFWDEEEEEEEQEDWEPGYIIISSRTSHENDKNRIKIFKYSQGKIYEEIDEFNRDNQLFKTNPYTGYINEYVQKAKEDLDLLAANSEGKKLLDWFENKFKLSICATLDENDTRNNCYEYSITYQGLPVKLPIEDYPFSQMIPSYIVLGHEMTHAMNYHLGRQDLSKKRGETMMHDEIYATHIENKIRRAAGISLRNYYNPNSERMFGEAHYSLYINKNEDYPLNLPKEYNSKEAFNYDTIQPDK